MSCIIIKQGDQELVVTYSIQPAEPESGLQGPYIEEISEILWGNIDVTKLLEPYFGNIEDEIWREIKRISDDV